MNRHHAFIIEAGVEAGVALAQSWVEKELGMETRGNPDVAILRYGLLSVEDARKVSELAAGAPFAGDYKVVIIATTRAYHEAQNALLKIFEEPPHNTFLFLILPSLGGLLPTLRSRVQVLDANVRLTKSHIPEIAEEFLRATKEERTALIKKLTSGKDEEDRRENRDTAIALVNGIEAAIYSCGSRTSTEHVAALSDIATLRAHLYDRSAPVKMILEHLSLTIPKGLSADR